MSKSAMKRRRRACMVLGMALWWGTGGTAQTIPVNYELVDDSWLGLTTIDEDGNFRTTVAHLSGNFTLDVIQREELILGVVTQWIEASVRNVYFRSTSGPEYEVTGRGFYLIGGNQTSPTGLPARGAMELGLEINGNIIAFTTEITRFTSFPRIEAGLFEADLPPYGWGLRIVARPVGDEAARFFRRGDVNGDVAKNLTDAVAVLNALFGAAEAFDCEDAADANDDGRINLADCVEILTSLFKGGGDLPLPARLCGLDSTDDTLDCGGQVACMEEG